MLPNSSQSFQNAGVVRGIYEQFCKTIESDGLREQFFCQRSPSSSRSNEEARQCVRSAPASLPQRANSSATLRIVRLDSGEQKFSAEQKECAVIYRNASNRVVLAGSTICPRNSAFLLGDVRLARHLMGVGLDKFDFIVMDPPWPNRTVKRQKTYETFNRDFSADNPIEGMCALQIGELLSPEGLVAIWLSNSETAHRTAELMLERWKLRRVAQWHWLKVCKSADPVCEFRPEHKVPFESVLLACKADAKEQGGGFDSIKEDFCIISIPSAIPSRKPPISLLLTQMAFIPEVRNGLELYARYMLPRFTSVGFEANKFQHEYYFCDKQ